MAREPRYPLFDGLRAIAALSVLAFHVFFQAALTHAEIPSRWLIQLDVGVDVFFVISGFLLYRPWVRARLADRPAPAVRPYAIRRLARIVPAYWLALTVIALWTGKDDVFGTHAPLYYGFAQVYDQDTLLGGIGQAWSLCVEMSFYVVLPVFALAWRRRPAPGNRRALLRGELAVLAGVFLAGAVWKGFWLHHYGGSVAKPVLFTLPAYLDLFALGMGLAVISVAGAGERVGRLSGWCWAVALAAYLLACRVDSDIPRFLFKDLCAIALVVPAALAAGRRDAVRRALGAPALLWIGVISYGVYLWHSAFVDKFAQAGLVTSLGVGGFGLAVLACTLAVAAASWYGLERHVLTLGRRRAQPDEGSGFGSEPAAAQGSGPETGAAAQGSGPETGAAAQGSGPETGTGWPPRPASPRAAVRGIAVAILLLGPTVVAFASGGYFDEPRLTAALVAWGLVVVAAFTAERPLPRRPAPLVAVGGLVALAVWVTLSERWAPLSTPAVADAQRLLLYVGALIASAALLRGRAARRATEPMMAVGALIVVGYGISERLAPGLIHLHRSLSAGGRLEQPLTYWNAMGALGAVGLTLCARLAADLSRDRRISLGAAAAAPVLGLGVFLSFSRGAIAAAAVGLLALALLVPERRQLRVSAALAVCAVAASGVAALLPAVRTLKGAHPALQGALMLGVLAGLCALAAFAAHWLGRAAPDDAGTRPAPRVRAAIAVALALAVVATPLAAATAEKTLPRNPAFGATTARLGSTDSHRSDYWRVALGSFADHPLAGTGTSGFRVAWLRHRHLVERVQDAHSLYLETAAELGVVGLAALLAFIGGVAVSARRVLGRRRGELAGAIAALAVWAMHAGLDWDWEMPGLTLFALVLAGAVIARADRGGGRRATGLAERVALVAVALAVGFVLGRGLQVADREDRGRALARNLHELTRAREAEIRDLFRSAGDEAPDVSPEVLEGQLDLLVDQPRPALALFADVVRREPENAEVWRLVAGAARGVDPALRARAVARLAVLDPRGPKP